jgi:hypothetical protein
VVSFVGYAGAQGPYVFNHGPRRKFLVTQVALDSAMGTDLHHACGEFDAQPCLLASHDDAASYDLTRTGRALGKG